MRPGPIGLLATLMITAAAAADGHPALWWFAGVLLGLDLAALARHGRKE